MEMHQVRYFLGVAQELNFSRAAEKCSVSQPALSRAIQQLEGELGGPLFHRERHLTHLTELGEMVCPHLETVYEAAVKAKRLSQDVKPLDDRTHVMPLFAEQMVIPVHRGHRLAGERAFPVRELNGECYIHRMNCEFAGYADHILEEKGVTCTPTYWSERDDWTLAMVAAGLGFAF